MDNPDTPSVTNAAGVQYSWYLLGAAGLVAAAVIGLLLRSRRVAE